MDDNPSEEERQMETQQQAGPVPTPARPRLVRSRRDRKIAGVAGGIAEHLNIDPILVRIGFLVSVIAGGLGIVLYLAGWLLIPEEGDQESLGAPFVARLRRAPWLAVLLFVIGGTVLFSQVLWWDGGGIFWALVLIGAGWLIYQDAPISGRRRDEPPPPPSASESKDVTAPAPAAAVEPRVRRPRSFLGRYTFGALLLAIGLAAMLANAGAFSLDVGQYPALALTIVGAGLLVGTLWGRARGLIALGILLVPFAWAGALVDVPLEGGFADRYYAPMTPALVEDEYRLVGGQMNFDLTDLEWGSEPIELEATVAFGEIEVAVPKDVEVELHGSVAGGEIQFFEDHRSGYDVEVDSTGGGDGSAGTLMIDARASFGRIEVTDSVAELTHS
jgi:phage shock protein PspC (stress-responsive transcriptional regulator)